MKSQRSFKNDKSECIIFLSFYSYYNQTVKHETTFHTYSFNTPDLGSWC